MFILSLKYIYLLLAIFFMLILGATFLNIQTGKTQVALFISNIFNFLIGIGFLAFLFISTHL